MGFATGGEGIYVLDQWDGSGSIQYRQLEWSFEQSNDHTNYVNSRHQFLNDKLVIHVCSIRCGHRVRFVLSGHN